MLEEPTKSQLVVMFGAFLAIILVELLDHYYLLLALFCLSIRFEYKLNNLLIQDTRY